MSLYKFDIIDSEPKDTECGSLRIKVVLGGYGELKCLLTAQTAKNPRMIYKNESFTGNRIVLLMPSTVIQFHCYNHHITNKKISNSSAQRY